MKVKINFEKLKERIMQEPEENFDAGVPSEALVGNFAAFVGGNIKKADTSGEILPLRSAFGTLIRQLRKSEGLSIEDLAKRIIIEEAEIRNIEHDPHYQPRPRTIHNLANHFKINPRELMKLSGAAKTVDDKLKTEALKFAAMSDDLSQLTRDELRILHEFIKFLNSEK